MAENRCRLYLISPPVLDDLGRFLSSLEEALGAGDVACLQVRLKAATEAQIAEATAAIRPLAHAHDVALLMNDRPDLARSLGCDGVHIGQDDTPYKQARALLGPDAIIGVTCHDSRDLAMTAGEAGADYVAFGAFHPTETKKPKARAEVEILSIWAEMTTVPSVAVGGITVDNAAPLISAGADFLAVSGGVWNHPAGPGEAVRRFNGLMAG